VVHVVCINIHCGAFSYIGSPAFYYADHKHVVIPSQTKFERENIEVTLMVGWLYVFVEGTTSTVPCVIGMQFHKVILLQVKKCKTLLFLYLVVM